MMLKETIKIMTREISCILSDNKSTIYLYGSVVIDDFKLGWSDIDILVLTESEVTEEQASKLVNLRQNVLERYPGNPYFRLFEGGMLSLDAFLSNTKERTVYWGTSGQRITDSYKMDSFGMAELLDNGVLLHGDDIRDKMIYPSYAQMRDDIAWHVQGARKYGVVVGWLLDIARGIYTLRTGKVIAKTAAGEWALENNLCPDADALEKAIQCRKEAHLMPERSIDNFIIQRFADVIDAEFANTAERFAQSELQRMNFAYDTLSLIRNKDGVSVWRVNINNGSVVMKCFDKQEYRREIVNYQLLKSLGIPALRFIAHTNCSFIMEDIECSKYRLATIEDVSDPKIAIEIARWYKTLHINGREHANTHTMFDECDTITIENINTIKEKTGTEGLPVWQLIEEKLDIIRSVAISLPRTLNYNDFYYTNLVVARDGSSALVFDYNLLGKGYIYSDIRNVCCSLGNDDAREAFLSEYGNFDENEKLVDDVIDSLYSLYVACQREIFPNWANNLLEKLKDGTLLAAVEKLLEEVGR
jgi:predicted nucleotidyltransferase